MNNVNKKQKSARGNNKQKGAEIMTKNLSKTITTKNIFGEKVTIKIDFFCYVLFRGGRKSVMNGCNVWHFKIDRHECWRAETRYGDEIMTFDRACKLVSKRIREKGFYGEVRVTVM